MDLAHMPGESRETNGSGGKNLDFVPKLAKPCRYLPGCEARTLAEKNAHVFAFLSRPTGSEILMT
jgi:hypothetical protein